MQKNRAAGSLVEVCGTMWFHDDMRPFLVIVPIFLFTAYKPHMKMIFIRLHMHASDCKFMSRYFRGEERDPAQHFDPRFTNLGRSKCAPFCDLDLAGHGYRSAPATVYLSVGRVNRITVLSASSAYAAS